MSNCMKIRPVIAELFRTDGQTAIHDEANKLLFVVLRRSLIK
jgi:hypothetical protein